MSDAKPPLCARCRHAKHRHFAGSMVRGHHACLVPLCECRRFIDGDAKKEKSNG